ncbi:pilus assembly protein CpaF [Kitasatospora sp. GP30]|uniref:TadA family conjugal transfer-associated ATPase n=1 Tax=Kitasatospora sp. GP30 TaxID=3035084 RepID=UPI000C713EA9|nr:TadA family conjugal transfer-associated ATPase [Kitasatospora sp. GP30]MDH6138301.1 pilus assembly protein CpaF [Kitasatospora sp. GP30]
MNAAAPPPGRPPQHHGRVTRPDHAPGRAALTALRRRAGTGPSAGPGAVPERAAALLDAVRLRLAEAGAPPTASEVAAAVRAARPSLDGDSVLDAVRAVRSELVGAGPLDELLSAPGVTDVLVNGPDEIWVDHGDGLRRESSVRFPNAEAVRHLAHRLATVAGRRLDDARPWVDGRLPDGTRLHAVLPPIATGCTHISLRICRPRPFTLGELVAAQAIPQTGADLLRGIVRARLSYLVSGGTGSGKTTLLAAMLGMAGHGERIVIAEDSAELLPDHPHVVRLQGRPPNQEGLGELTTRDLVRQALRMRPDRLVVGEVRGPEVLDLLSALNTGHEGGCGTVHANAAADVPARLEALGSMAGLRRLALHSQLLAGLDLVIHLTRDHRSGRRRVAELHTLDRNASGLAVTAPAVIFRSDGLVSCGPGWDRLVRLCAARGVMTRWGNR